MPRTTSKPAGRASARPAPPRKLLVVTRRVRAYARTLGLNTSSQTIAALSEQVYALLERAAARTQANGRTTLKPHDV
jgi:hypothetical protein